ncbi:MAG: hypothetical protein ACI4QT_08775 [Kiritimatiellia bacterium]
MKRLCNFAILFMLIGIVSLSANVQAAEAFSSHVQHDSIQESLSMARRLWDSSFVDYYTFVTNIYSKVEAAESDLSTREFAHSLLDQLSSLPISMQLNRFGNAERVRMILVCKAATMYGGNSPGELAFLLAQVLRKIKSGIIADYVPRTEIWNSSAFSADSAVREAYVNRVRKNREMNETQQSLHASNSRILSLLCHAAWSATKGKTENDRLGFLSALAETANLSPSEKEFLFEGVQPVTSDESIVLVHGEARGKAGTNRVVRRRSDLQRKTRSIYNP